MGNLMAEGVFLAKHCVLEVVVLRGRLRRRRRAVEIQIHDRGHDLLSLYHPTTTNRKANSDQTNRPTIRGKREKKRKETRKQQLEEKPQIKEEKD